MDCYGFYLKDGGYLIIRWWIVVGLVDLFYYWNKIIIYVFSKSLVWKVLELIDILVYIKFVWEFSRDDFFCFLLKIENQLAETKITSRQLTLNQTFNFDDEKPSWSWIV